MTSDRGPLPRRSNQTGKGEHMAGNGRGAVTLGITGVILVVAHLVIGAVAAVATAQWLGGVAVGGVLVMGAVLHTFAHKRRTRSAG